MQHLSLNGKQWIGGDEHISHPDALLLHLLNKRQIALNCEQETITHPSQLHDIDTAVMRIRYAKEKGERVGIFGDYDCDGVTAVAILLRYCQRHDIQTVVRLPHRIHDGYGLTKNIVDEFHSAGVTLNITADKGITAVDPIDHASSLGIDVIVTDHHRIPEEVPKAVALVHPALTNYPRPHPCGAGVAFQLVRALEETHWDNLELDLALAMIGTVADVMELRGDNRVLVKQGLIALERLDANEPLSKLIENANCTRASITSTDIAFRIAPRLNAAGRMQSPEKALEALLDGGEALVELEHLNQERQALTRSLMTHAEKEVSSQEASAFIHSANAEYTEGTIGLIAGRLCEKYGRPSMAVCMRDDMCIASLRSTKDYNIIDGLSGCQKYLESFGGHIQAAGCTFSKHNLEVIVQTLKQDCGETIAADKLHPVLEIDATIDANMINIELIEKLSTLEPFGHSNPTPLLLLTNVTLDQPRTIGADDSHVQGEINGVKCVGFSQGTHLTHLHNPLDIVCQLSINEWNGIREPQIILKDIRVHADVIHSV